MAIYKKDKEIRLNVRVSSEQACFIDKLAASYGRSTSDIIRMLIDHYMWGGYNENIKNNIDN